ncbi:MAG: hypothetical protein ACK55I_41805, partial [bacterium]
MLARAHAERHHLQSGGTGAAEWNLHIRRRRARPERVRLGRDHLERHLDLAAFLRCLADAAKERDQALGSRGQFGFERQALHAVARDAPAPLAMLQAQAARAQVRLIDARDPLDPLIAQDHGVHAAPCAGIHDACEPLGSRFRQVGGEVAEDQ